MNNLFKFQGKSTRLLAVHDPLEVHSMEISDDRSEGKGFKER